MKHYGISEKSFLLIISAITRYPEVDEVVIFGSRANGSCREGSDIDLAIKGEHCNRRIAIDLQAHLNEELPIPYKVDVVSYNDIKNLALKDQIDKTGQLFFSSSAVT